MLIFVFSSERTETVAYLEKSFLIVWLSSHKLTTGNTQYGKRMTSRTDPKSQLGPILAYPLVNVGEGCYKDPKLIKCNALVLVLRFPEETRHHSQISEQLLHPFKLSRIF